MKDRNQNMLVFIPWGGKKKQSTKSPNPVGELCTHKAEKLIGVSSTDSFEVVREHLTITYLMKASAQ